MPHLVLTRNKALGPKLSKLVLAARACWTLGFPLIANSWGWIFTEMGRQPWVVYGVLRPGDAVSPGVSQGEVLTSMIVFTALYAILAVIEVKLLAEVRQGGPARADRGRPQPAHQDRRRRPDDADRPMAFSY